MSDEVDNLIVLPGVSVTLAEEPTDEVEEIDGLAPPDPEFLLAAVEAVLFGSDQPLSTDAVRVALNVELEGAVESALEMLRADYQERGAGIELVEVGGGWQMRTVQRAAPYVARALGAKPVRLSRPAVETLAIVAYRQPVTRSEVEDLRGVECGGVLRSLVSRGLVGTVGRTDDPGRPLLYGTTAGFLSFFGLGDLSDLPTLRDLREMQSDDPAEGPVPLPED
ncbi:MAG: SMC-Scp complex subunit ScpB [Myxococcota bacterium]|nr:SMC-Scp complex subunit ScpB [Myxococcota bacterium]